MHKLFTLRYSVALGMNNIELVYIIRLRKAFILVNEITLVSQFLLADWM